VQRFEAPVLARVALRPTLIHLTLDTSSLPGAPVPGQFFMTHCAGVYLRRPLFPCHIEAGRLAALLPLGQDLGLTWLAARQIGETVDLIGPLGRGFSLEKAGGNLLLVSWGPGIAPLLALAERALAGGWAVALLAGFERPDLAVPTTLLPPAVEYQVAVGAAAQEEMGQFLRDTLLWADRVCSAGGMALYSRLASAIEAHRLGLRPGLAQVLVEAPMACGVGACGACAVETRRGTRQACHHGPVFDLAELAI
jgi:dihydroorotate dehydrogenase electron transfer subunit